MFYSQFWQQSDFFCQFEIRLSWIPLYFQKDKYWYTIRILANLMNRNDQINIAKLIYRYTSSALSERRRHFRLSLRLPMEFSFPESSRRCLACMVDICEGGLLMNTPEKLDIGQGLRVKFYYDSVSGLDCVQALGEVNRADSLGNSAKEYRCAVRFVDLSPDILKKLSEFLKNLY